MNSEQKILKLSAGKECIIDAEDFDYLNQWKWSYGADGYAMRSSKKSDNLSKRKTIFLHTLLINKNNQKLEIDHINGNRLDSRKCNLRLVTRNVNQMNKVKKVTYDKERNKWRFSIRYGNNQKLFKRYKTEEEAIYYLTKYCKELQGIDVRLC